MSGTRFLPPVKVALPEAATGACVVEIDNPRDANRLNRQTAVGGFHIESVLWQVASERLARAVRDPTPENVEDARQAFLQLVCELS